MITLVFLLALSASVYARNFTINPGDAFVPTLQSLVAGDIVNFLPGTHVVSSRAGFTLPGTSSEPIIIQGLGSGVIVKRNDASNNIWDFSGTNFVVRNIEFIGGSRGLRLGDGKNVSNALLEDIKIHDTSATALSFNDHAADYNNITVRRAEIYNTGSETSECVYPGCNSGDCTFRNSVFEYIFCHDTLNAQSGYGSGINLKSGSYNNIVRHSVFWNVKGPGVFFYDSYDMGDNIAYNNLIVNSGDNGIQVTAGVVIENNIVINSVNSGIAGTVNQLKANTHARNIKILGNTVIGSTGDACLRGNDWGTNQNTIVVANNAFFCQNAPNGAFKITGDQTAATWLNNGYIGGSAPTGATAGVFVIGNESTELLDPSNSNYYPKSTSALINAGSAAQLTSIDFNCNPRNASAPTVGAYQYSTATNPGWTISKQMKPDCGSAGNIPGTSSSTDGGSTTAGEESAAERGVYSIIVLMFAILLSYLL